MNADNSVSRPPFFVRPPPCGEFGGRMPWGSPRPPFMRQYPPPYLRPPFGMCPEGFRLPSHMQAPPMFGPRGATVPPHIMNGFDQTRQKNNLHSHRGDNLDQKGFSYNYWCEPCDRGFKTIELLENHKMEHQKCGIDGCEYTAHANMVTKHIQMQHSTGLYNKIRNLKTPEDIQKWINERKKNYPSRANVEKKLAQKKECFDRGEKLQDNKNRFNKNKKDNNYMNNRSRRPSHPTGMKFSTTKPPPVAAQKKEKKIDETKVSASSEEETTYCNLKPFKGTSQLVRSDLLSNDASIAVLDDLDVEDDEWREDTSGKKEKEIAVCSALSSLISAYESSDDDDNEEEINNKVDKTKESLSKNSTQNDTKIVLGSCPPVEGSLDSQKLSDIDKDSNTVKDLESDDSGPDEIKIQKTIDVDTYVADSSIPSNHPNKEKRIRKRKHSQNENNNTPKKPNTHSNAQKTANTNANKITHETLAKSPHPNFKRKLPKTLLEKLLENDIRSERNIILQCVHYIVENNFFDA